MKQKLKRNNFAFEAQIYQYVHVFDYPDHRKKTTLVKTKLLEINFLSQQKCR